MSFANASFDEVFDDLQSRFIVNVPSEELSSISRVCFQIEQAHWFYEDFVREENPKLPSYSLRRFLGTFFEKSELLRSLEGSNKQGAFDEFIEYKIRIPVCGVILVNKSMDKCILVKSWGAKGGWSFPKGKINKDEAKLKCAVREVLEETGFDAGAYVNEEDYHETTIREQIVRLYIAFGVDEATDFKTQTRKEIEEIKWFNFSDLPAWKAKSKATLGRFYLIAPFVNFLKRAVKDRKNLAGGEASRSHPDDKQTASLVSLQQDSAMLRSLLGINGSSNESIQESMSTLPNMSAQNPPLSVDLMALLKSGQDPAPSLVASQVLPAQTSKASGTNTLLDLFNSKLLPKPPQQSVKVDSTSNDTFKIDKYSYGQTNGSNSAVHAKQMQQQDSHSRISAHPALRDNGLVGSAASPSSNHIIGPSALETTEVGPTAAQSTSTRTSNAAKAGPTGLVPLFFSPHTNLFPDEIIAEEDGTVTGKRVGPESTSKFTASIISPVESIQSLHDTCGSITNLKSNKAALEEPLEDPTQLSPQSIPHSVASGATPSRHLHKYGPDGAASNQPKNTSAPKSQKPERVGPISSVQASRTKTPNLLAMLLGDD